MKRRWFFLVLALVVGIALVGCNLFSALSGAKQVVQEAQTLVPTMAAAATSAANSQGGQMPTSQPQATEAPPSVSVTIKTPPEDKNLKSFVLHYTLSVEFPKRNEKFVLIDVDDTEILNDKGQLSYHTVMKMPAQKSVLEGIKVGDKVWVSDGSGNWVTGTADQLDTFQGSSNLFFDDLFGSDISDLRRPDSDWKYEGNANVNGVETMHFSLKQGALPTFAADRLNMLFLNALPAVKVQSVKASSAASEVYIARDGLLVKGSYVLTGVAITEKGEKRAVKIVYEYDITHINDPNLKVEPPKGASQSVKAPFPLPPNAKLKMAAGNMQVFTVPSTKVEDVMNFLAQNLPKAGFTISNKMGSNDTAWDFTVTGKGATYFVEVGADPDNPSDTDIAITK